MKVQFGALSWRRWPRRWLAAGGLAAAVAAVILVLLTGRADSAVQTTPKFGSLWLPSPGTVTLVDGTVAKASGYQSGAIAYPPIVISKTGDPLQVSQVGATAYVADQAAGTVTRIDGATFAPTPQRGFGQGVRVFATPKTVFAVSPAKHQVEQLDPATLGSPSPTSADLDASSSNPAVLDADGTLWWLDQGLGRIRSLRAGAVTTGDRYPGGSQLTLAAGRPVLVETTTSAVVVQAIRTDDTLAESRPVTGVSGAAVAGGSDRNTAYLADSRSGNLVAVAVSNNEQPSVNVASSGDLLLPPVEALGRVFVADVTRNRIVVVDASKLRITSTASFPRLTKNYQFQVSDEGIVYYNDPTQGRAGVLSPSGLPRPTRKATTGPGNANQNGQQSRNSQSSGPSQSSNTSTPTRTSSPTQSASQTSPAPPSQTEGGGPQLTVQVLPPTTGGSGSQLTTVGPTGPDSSPTSTPPSSISSSSSPTTTTPSTSTSTSAATYVLTTTAQGNGAVTTYLQGSKTNCSAGCKVARGAYLISETPPSSGPPNGFGTEFGQFSPNCVPIGDGTFCKIDVEQNAIVTATFVAKYQVTVTLNGDGGGEVQADDKSVCTGGCILFGSRTLTATPNPGSQFDGWSGDCAASGTGPCSLSPGGNVNVGATFDKISASVNVDITGSGAVDVALNGNYNTTCTSSCSVAGVKLGDQVTFSPRPDANWQVASASPASCSAPCTFSVTFQQLQSLISVIVNGPGSVTGSPSGISCQGTTGTCSASYVNGTEVTLTAAPAPGANFTAWTSVTGWASGCSGQGTCQVTAPGSATAGFAAEGGVAPGASTTVHTNFFGKTAVCVTNLDQTRDASFTGKDTPPVGAVNLGAGVSPGATDCATLDRGWVGYDVIVTNTSTDGSHISACVLKSGQSSCPG